MKSSTPGYRGVSFARVSQRLTHEEPSLDETEAEAKANQLRFRVHTCVGRAARRR
jgi:hypothetical protein